VNDHIEQLKQQARTAMHEALAAQHAQYVALVRDGRGDHAPAQVLAIRMRELQDLLRKA
jgi:hypothetical protein